MTVLRREATRSYGASQEAEACLSQSCDACPPDRAHPHPPTATSKASEFRHGMVTGTDPADWAYTTGTGERRASGRKAAQMNPTSSREMATAILGAGLPLCVMRR